ncbi:unnamed protein product [Phytophthora fragariaefolia]|uniref:Unnamed protein product n=1 Tax=Phytophthora fragariaefolia TaxID=1490495 RepID=A0A9W7CW60_9STRA|nr:unnamed protein product [Phytophthora fragariaefolia]
MWLDSTIISKLQQFVNVSLDEAASVTIDDLFLFLEVELWLSFYHVTPGFFFDKENRSQYPPAERCMPFERYRTIPIALGKTSSPELEKTSQWIFTFGKNPSQYQQLISEKGERAAYWASKRLPIHTGTLPVHAHALAYRTGVGKVALGCTTMETAGPGYWTYATSPSSRHRDRHNDDLFSSFEAGVQELTMLQRTPDWFVLRKFRIAGSVAAKKSSIIARCGGNSTTDDIMIDPASDPDVNTIILLLLLQQRRQVSLETQEILNDGERPVERSHTKEALMKTCEELKCMCREAFLPVTGRKCGLVNRLLGVTTVVAPEQNTSAENARYLIDEALLSAWFMAPFSTQDTKIGTANEENIADHITAFLDKTSEHHIEKLKLYGLLCRGTSVAAFSPDNIASVLHTMRGRFNAVMEYKTRTTARTVRKEQNLASSHGKFTSVDVTTTGFGGSHCEVIPDRSHRLQILHNIVCGGVQDGFLVYASSSSIIRVIRVAVDCGVSWTYRAALEAIQKGYISWIFAENRAIPHFDSDQLGHCTDQRTLEQNLTLWKALVKVVDDRRQPPPPAKHIIPTLIALWNRIKGGIDVYSRYLKNVKSKHFRLSPTATVWLRTLMSLVYNAQQSLLCSSYKAYQNHKQNLPSFAAFCREAALALSERPRSQRPLSSISENVDQAPSHELGATFIYKKRLHFQTEIDMRISNRSAHLAVSIVVSLNYFDLLTAGNVDSNRRHVAAELRCLLSTESRHRKSRPQSSRIQGEF